MSSVMADKAIASAKENYNFGKEIDVSQHDAIERYTGTARATERLYCHDLIIV